MNLGVASEKNGSAQKKKKKCLYITAKLFLDKK